MSCCLAALLPHFLKNTHAHTRKHTHTDFFAQPFFCSLCAYASHESDSQTNKDLCHLIAHMSSKVCSQGDVPNQSKAEHTHTHIRTHIRTHTRFTENCTVNDCSSLSHLLPKPLVVPDWPAPRHHKGVGLGHILAASWWQLHDSP